MNITRKHRLMEKLARGKEITMHYKRRQALLTKLAAPKWVKMFFKLSPEAQKRIIENLRPGEERFLKELGAGGMRQADLVVGNLFGQKGLMARKLPIVQHKGGAKAERLLLRDVKRQMDFEDDLRRLAKGEGQFAHLRGRKGLLGYYDYAPEKPLSEQFGFFGKPESVRSQISPEAQKVLKELEGKYGRIWDVRRGNIAGDPKKGKILDMGFKGKDGMGGNFQHHYDLLDEGLGIYNVPGEKAVRAARENYARYRAGLPAPRGYWSSRSKPSGRNPVRSEAGKGGPPTAATRPSGPARQRPSRLSRTETTQGSRYSLPMGVTARTGYGMGAPLAIGVGGLGLGALALYANRAIRARRAAAAASAGLGSAGRDMTIPLAIGAGGLGALGAMGLLNRRRQEQ